MLLQKNIECGAVFCVCDFRVACFYVCAAFGFASVPYAPMPVLCPNTPKERIPLQVSVYQQNKHVLNSLCKLLSIRCLTCSKIQAIYFKIQGTYFKISALYFLQHALCFSASAHNIYFRSVFGRNFCHAATIIYRASLPKPYLTPTGFVGGSSLLRFSVAATTLSASLSNAFPTTDCLSVATGVPLSPLSHTA